MLDVHGYKSTAEDSKQLDALAREILRSETGHSNPDSLIGSDSQGNLWIYSSEEAKLYAESRDPTNPPTPSTNPADSPRMSVSTPPAQALDTAPGRRDSAPGRPLLKALTSLTGQEDGRVSRAESEPAIPTVDKSKHDEGYSYAKTLRLTSEQLVPSPPFFTSLSSRRFELY